MQTPCGADIKRRHWIYWKCTEKCNSVQLDNFFPNWSCALCKGAKLSKAIGINLSIVQGSGIGPSLYVIMESDLHLLLAENTIIVL